MKEVVRDQCRKFEQKEAPSIPAFDRQFEEQRILNRKQFQTRRKYREMKRLLETPRSNTDYCCPFWLRHRKTPNL
jgi:hypothetical protein